MLSRSAAPGAPALPRHVALLQRVIPAPLRTPTALRRFALWAVITNVVIVVSGGAVRLTNSGLGCPTWPRCTATTLTPTKAYAVHGLIEFSNRQLTFVVGLFAVACWLVSLARRQERTLATLLALSIPLQAVLGGITVLTDLNPWIVGSHFLVSALIILIAFALWWRVRRPEPPLQVPGPALQLARLTVLAAAVVLTLGTIVTGAGPHAGDLDPSGKVHRNGLNVSSMAQLHADSVMVLVGMSVGLLLLLYAVRAAPAARRAAWVLLAVEAGQGVIGYVQYFLHVPPLLVAVHMLGACLLWLAALWALFLLDPRAQPTGARRPAAGRLTAAG
jgi:cytochrome c oxidase assembly protein subunit 15